MTPAEALDNATRLLRSAEVTTDLALMKQLDEMAMSWVRIADLLVEHSEIQS